jgi:hypothetical protein
VPGVFGVDHNAVGGRQITPQQQVEPGSEDTPNVSRVPGPGPLTLQLNQRRQFDAGGDAQAVVLTI